MYDSFIWNEIWCFLFCCIGRITILELHCGVCSLLFQKLLNLVCVLKYFHIFCLLLKLNFLILGDTAFIVLRKQPLIFLHWQVILSEKNISMNEYHINYYVFLQVSSHNGVHILLVCPRYSRPVGSLVCWYELAGPFRHVHILCITKSSNQAASSTGFIHYMPANYPNGCWNRHQHTFILRHCEWRRMSPAPRQHLRESCNVRQLLSPLRQLFLPSVHGQVKETKDSIRKSRRQLNYSTNYYILVILIPIGLYLCVLIDKIWTELLYFLLISLYSMPIYLSNPNCDMLLNFRVNVLVEMCYTFQNPVNI